ncbi:hypothetical protein GXW82_14500 [Streptacidiphilus sp. 4-A2]|nr:hypothetical protein [Streptacidiphilus sp. 4-A2]
MERRPANFSLTTNKPVVSLPFNGPKLTGEGSSDRSTPVTRAPGSPPSHRPRPPCRTVSPAADQPGKAEVRDRSR